MCEHGFIGACAVCDGCGEMPAPELVHPIGCECEDCSAAPAPVWEVAGGITVELVKTEPNSVLVRLKGNKDLGRVLQAERG